MQNSLRIVSSLFLLCGLLLLESGCSPEAKKATHLQSADRFFDSGEYTSAEVEYLNVLKIDPKNAQAIGRLGIIYSEQGRLGPAIAYLRKGNELQPENLDIRIKLGQLALVTGNLKGAQEQANFILEHRPADPAAPELLVGTASKPEELTALRQRLLALPAPAPTSAPVVTALGAIALRQGNLKEAEKLVQQALSADPKFATAHTVRGTIALAQKDSAAATQAFKLAAEASPPRSSRRLQYAQFLIQSGNLAGGKQQLTELTQKVPDYVPAWIALGEVALIEKKFTEGIDLIGKALARDPGNLEASLLNGRLLLAKGDNAQAVAAFEKLAASYPKLPAVHLFLGRAYAESGDLDRAIDQSTEAVTLAPNYAEAALQLGTLQLRKRDFRGAVVGLKKLAQQRPDLGQARLLLADAYRAQGDLDSSLEIYRQLQKQAPDNPRVLFLVGTVLAHQQKFPEAREAFTKCLTLAPDYLPAVEQLVGLDVFEKKYSAASQRVDAQIAKDPKLAGPYLLRARILMAQNETTPAETALRKAIELQPDSPAAYLLLARLYVTSHQEEKALANFKTVTAKNPKNAEALMMTATIQNQLKDFAAARDSYEKLLAINPKFIPALNNLAYLYSEQFNQLDKAQELAQKALELLPDEPHGTDTFGWILFKKHQYTWALTQLEKSAAKMPDDAEVQFHLGMTHYMLGEDEAARTALQRTLQLDNNFPEKAVVQERLAILAIGPGNANAATKEKLEKAVAERPDDPVALIRLAAIYSREGAVEKALEAYRGALKVSPKNVAAMLELARLYAAQHDTAKALELAKNARKLAPDDPEIIHALGRLAYETGDQPWAFSLLQEAAGKKSGDPEILYDLAEAAYSVGRVSEAQDYMKRALGTGTVFRRTDEARRFLELTDLGQNPVQSSASAKIEPVLKSNPSYVPALMIKAALSEQAGQSSDAQEIYTKILSDNPAFTPAVKRLAILSAENRSKDQKALDLALKARTALPDDAEVAKALGIISYLRTDYGRAATLLKESAGKRGNDASLLFYLGMSQYQLKKTAESKQSLERALELNLKSDLAGEAKQTLANLK